MDIVTDLTSQAVSYLTVLQDIYKKAALLNKQIPDETTINDLIAHIAKKTAGSQKTEFQKDEFKKESERMREIIWRSRGYEDAESSAINLFGSIVNKLCSWIKRNGYTNTDGFGNPDEKHNLEQCILHCSPNEWRNIIRSILYKNPEERLELAGALHYMPIQIIMSLGARRQWPQRQRILQVWNTVEYPLISKRDHEVNKTWWDCTVKLFYDPIKKIHGGEDNRRDLAAKLLKDDSFLRRVLLDAKSPIPFETLFNEELSEIATNRKNRLEDPGNRGLIFTDEEKKELTSEDPLLRAKRMNLLGLSLSGGGIRSATFNLGLVQALAEYGILHRIDYLSTVSGGGYIGSWLSSWINRSGSVSKVADRLDTTKSTDPLAEEVRPIRWLRMYSNYLSPNKSIMSADAWTMGITWIRNTLINQVILLMLLCTGLSFITLLFTFWESLASRDPMPHEDWKIFAGSFSFVAAAFLAGFAMHMYGKEFARLRLFQLGKARNLTFWLIASVAVPAFFLSAWFINRGGIFKTGSSTPIELLDKISILWPAGFGIGLCILFIALLGNYTVDAEKRNWEKRGAIPLIIISSFVAAGIGIVLMAGAWDLLDKIYENGTSIDKPQAIAFVIGLPLILEVISAGVVVRMLLLGRLFPDERREWWGRMGAIVHRFSLLWIVLTTCTLLMPDIISGLDLGKLGGVLGVSWAAVIGLALKFAYNPGRSQEQSGLQSWSLKEVFVRFAPYLFMIGFLLLGAAIHRVFIDYAEVKFPGKLQKISVDALITISFGLAAWLLSWRAGVNEFSLHLFYRNRLVRAFLGATRRRADRGKTANPFTGFDRDDDIRLSELRSDHGYYGPFPLINTSLSATVSSDLDRQDRKAESFVFTPLYCGFDISPTRSASYSKTRLYDYGYRPTEKYGYHTGPFLGTAMAISGAAVNPNMGYHSSAPTAFLLTAFNLRLGWWMGNPRLEWWEHSDPTIGINYTIKDLLGKSDADSDYVCLSDGGHFDNMGLYELVRRKCKYIILGDAEEDKLSTCEGLSNAIRRCRIDFGVEIEINTAPITAKDPETGLSKAHFAAGTIKYPGDSGPSGKLIYIKTTLTEDLPTDIREYKMQNKDFPQQSTSDQFFDEAQFESYRMLGYQSLKGIDFAKILTWN